MSEFAYGVVNTLEARGCVLFQNDSVVAAIYLDPRVTGSLTKEQKRQAEDHLKNLHDMLQKGRKQSLVAGQAEEKTAANEAEKESDGNSECTLYEKLRREKVKTLQDEESEREADKVRIMLRNFLTRMMNSGDNLLYYWQLIKVSEAQLYDLAMIVLATSSTQVSVETLFSGLWYIHVDSESSLEGGHHRLDNAHSVQLRPHT